MSKDKVIETRWEDRHPGTHHLLSLFEYKHLPYRLQVISEHFAKVANEMVNRLEDGPELTTGLRKLLEAKDCFVRQAVIDARGNEPIEPQPGGATWRQGIGKALGAPLGTVLPTLEECIEKIEGLRESRI